MALPLSYHWGNLTVRKTTTALTILVVAAVVGVFTWMSGFAGAMQRSLVFANDDAMLIVMKRGATSEGNSAIPIDEYNRLSLLTETARDPESGDPLRSPEMLSQVSLPRVGDPKRSQANVAVRGVTEIAFKVHASVRVDGPIFSTAEPEVIVGRMAARQFEGLKIGETVSLGYAGDRPYRVVAHFSANDGPLESEIWAYLPSLMNSYQRDMYSSVSLRLADGVDPAAVIEKIEGPSIQLTAVTEKQYWDTQAGNIRLYLKIVSGLVAVMSLAAMFSIANTMFASVAGRVQEFAMLRTIGYSRGSILASVVLEAVILAVIGGLLGVMGCAAWLAAAGSGKDMFGANTFTTLAFDISITPWTVVWSVGLVTLVAVAGAAAPAFKASRLQVVQALRDG
ncbi:MAG: FtsX-like permease family protein [Phycisphaerae bacterium]